MTTLTDREKALVEAARILERTTHVEPWQLRALYDAVRAYDPPKEKVPVLPAWDDFLKGREAGLRSVNFASEMCAHVGHTWVDRATYNAIREATAKEAE